MRNDEDARPSPETLLKVAQAEEAESHPFIALFTVGISSGNFHP